MLNIVFGYVILLFFSLLGALLGWFLGYLVGMSKKVDTKKALRYQCANCLNTCLSFERPKKECVCKKPDWKLMKHQQSYIVGQEDYYLDFGEI